MPAGIEQIRASGGEREGALAKQPKVFARLCKVGAVKGAEPLSHSAEGESF